MLDHDPIQREFIQFLKAASFYIVYRFNHAGLNFEKAKSFVVEVLLERRGANTSAFVHFSVVAMAIAVLVGGGVFSSTAVVSGSYPGVPVNPLVAGASTEDAGSGVITSEITPVTIISDKPRDKVIEYEVKSGDTVSTIAAEFAVSENTIYWENNIGENTKLKVGQTIRVLPVSGIAHKVLSGDTIYSVAKRYRANAQAVLDFPFNDVSDDFNLATGQVLIVPDGTPPEKPKAAPTQYLAQQNIDIAQLGSAQFVWPASGGLSQYFSWYHPGIDVSNLGGGPIRASDGGTVSVAGWPDSYGYGNRVFIDHGNGYTSLYAHMSTIYVSSGQRVSKGDVLGMMGSTGRSTGVHLHLEIRKDGTALNPLSILGK